MKLFWSFARQAFHNAAIYRVDYWLNIVTTFLMMYSVYWIWHILYTAHPGAFGVSLQQVVSYGVLGMAMETVFNPGQGPQSYISTQIRTGGIDTDLAKPLDFHLHMLARNFGEMSFRFTTLVLPSILIGFGFLGLRPPGSLLNLLSFLVSLILGYLVLFSLNYLVAMLAVLTLDIRTIAWAYASLLRFFGGQMVPLWLFPGIAGVMAAALPFRSIYSIPLSIYIGKMSNVEVAHALLFQAIWVVVLVAIGRFAWIKVHTRLVVQGG
ncbi:MAG: ABC-2 family transporter protein [Alicyclobacillus sp.]|nr:ABC-2 family transporter protein [Alicyclobacillus sp.]